ncbi:MAG: hypothetical protein WC140_07030 [Bacteroidales bacterium]
MNSENNGDVPAKKGGLTNNVLLDKRRCLNNEFEIGENSTYQTLTKNFSTNILFSKSKEKKLKTVGITYDLKSSYLKQGFTEEQTAEFDDESTIIAIEEELTLAGFKPERIGNIFQLVKALSKGKKWDLVFNISECMYGDGRESAVPALLDQYQIPYIFSGPVVMGISLNKYVSRLVIEAGGVAVSPGRIICNITDIDIVLDDLASGKLSYPLFLKPVAEGTGKGITDKSIINNNTDLRKLSTEMLNSYHQSVLVEEYLSGREFTVGIVGSGTDTQVIGGMEIICRDGLPYSNFVKENYKEYVNYLALEDDIKKQCEDIAVRVWQILGGLDGGRIDLRADRNGRICFMEVNPLAGLNPNISDFPILTRLNGKNYHYIMKSIIESAIKRTKIQNG